MLVFQTEKTGTPIELVSTSEVQKWREDQEGRVAAWADRAKFKATANQFFAVPDENGYPSKVVAGTGDSTTVESIGSLCTRLSAGDYYLDEPDPSSVYDLVLGWGMGSYEFSKYRSKKSKADGKARLIVDPEFEYVRDELDSIFMVRDLINTSAGDMLPDHLEAVVNSVCKEFDVDLNVTRGDELLESGYRTIHSVGRASATEPRLMDFSWGDVNAPKVTLLGKGVCFDSGGLDLKSAAGMREMKKDMAGAAIALGLARVCMARKLNVRLRVLIPAVENAVAGNAYRPGDVIKSYKGTTVEVGNTDAEGRLILCDALALAAEEKPALMIDFSTLTGAARTALGPDISAMLSNDEDVSRGLVEAGKHTRDPIWPLPLFEGYRSSMKSPIADLSNTGSLGQGGAITAALFLEHFVDKVPWVHFDLMGSNTKTRPAHPSGGEAMALRAVFHYLGDKYGSSD